MRRPGLDRRIAAALLTSAAVAVTALAAPGAALACTPEQGPLPIRDIVHAGSIVIVGRVERSDYGADLVVRVSRVLRGSATGRLTVHDEGTCPFYPDVGERVVVAADASDTVAGWILSPDGSAVAWYHTQPSLKTYGAILAAFGAPDTATAPPPAVTPRTSGAWPAGILVVVGLIGFLAGLARRTRVA